MRGAPAGCPLTLRQLSVVAALAGGASNDVVARDLDIAPRTVHTHLNRIYRQLGVPTRNGVGDREELIRRATPWLLAAFPAPDPDPPLTPVHSAYGHVIDRFFAERTREAEALVTAGYVALMGATGVRPAMPRSQPDIDELLLRMARGLQRPIPLDDAPILLDAA